MTQLQSIRPHSSGSNLPNIQASFPYPYSNADVSVAPCSITHHSHSAAATVNSCVSPWLMPLVYPLGHRLVIPAYFRRVDIVGQENLFIDKPIILAPTHRSRWDALIVPYAAGKLVTGKHLRFMVSADEMLGLQGWFIRRLGGFPVDTRKPSIATLRYTIELLHRRESLVIFPEGNIHHGQPVQPLKPGLARLALQAESLQPGLDIHIVPMSIKYGSALVPWRTTVRVAIGTPLSIAPYTSGHTKQQAKHLTQALEQALKVLHD